MAAVKVKTDKSPSIKNYQVPAEWVKDLNFFDMTGSKAKTKGTSNKFYHIELQEANDGKCQLYTEYGPTGTVQCREWRYFADDRASAEKEFERIVKSKTKKGYVVIDVAQRAIGSAEAQKHVKAVQFKNAEVIETKISSLNHAQKSIVSLFFDAQDTFVAETLKCPLGQLSNSQIDLGREALDKAKVIVNSAKKLSEKKKEELEVLTNEFYGLIPHNPGSGARGQRTDLLLDTLDKIVGKESDLDTLLDAKQVSLVLKEDSTVDNKYKSLNC